MQERKLSKQPKDVRTNSELNSVNRFKLLEILEIVVECTTASRNI